MRKNVVDLVKANKGIGQREKIARSILTIAETSVKWAIQWGPKIEKDIRKNSKLIIISHVTMIQYIFIVVANR